MNTIKQKPAPKTTPGKFVVRKTKNRQVDIEIYAEVLSDKTGSHITGGETTNDPVGAVSDGRGNTYLSMTPVYNWQIRGGIKTITKLHGVLQIKRNVRIQTTYGPKAKPEDVSAYGRGTTMEDEKAGNTSLGFHEACHREDFIDYLKTKTLPTFKGRVGMSEQQYLHAQNQFSNAINNYFQEMDKYSYQRTDEVGYKKSVYEAKGERQ